jgi:hypothetical protein
VEPRKEEEEEEEEEEGGGGGGGGGKTKLHEELHTPCFSSSIISMIKLRTMR